MKRKQLISEHICELVLLVCTIIVWAPIYYFVIGAFKQRTDIVRYPLTITSEMFTGGNFSYALDKMQFFTALRNTGAITVASLLIVIFCGSLAGFAISRVNLKIFKVYYSALIALMVVPFIGTVIPLVVQSVQLNIYNTMIGPILIHSAWQLPFSVFLYTGFMRGLPKELEEAAYIDGCSMFKVYFRIFLPLLAPVTATCCIRSGITIWNDYLVSNALLNNARMPTMMVGVRLFFGERVTEYGYAFAGVIAASLPIIVLFLSLQKYFIKGLTAGSLKG